MGRQFAALAIFASFAVTAFAESPSNFHSGADGSGDVCDPAEGCENEADICCPHVPGPDAPFTCAPPPCFRSSGETCCPGDECSIEGDLCCPHAPGPSVPFTCGPPPCFR